MGTTFCLTVDDEILKSGMVTLRDRDTIEQKTMSIDEVISFVLNKINE